VLKNTQKNLSFVTHQYSDPVAINRDEHSLPMDLFFCCRQISTAQIGFYRDQTSNSIILFTRAKHKRFVRTREKNEEAKKNEEGKGKK